MIAGPGVKRAARIAATLSCLLAAGCSEEFRVEPMPPPAEPATQPVPTAPIEPELPPPAAPKPEAAAQPPAPPPPEKVRAPAPPAEPAPTITPQPKPPAIPAAPAAAVAPPPAPKPVTPPVAARPSAPPLNLDSLETRLRETRAIGVFTKVSLKNQVDDLLEKFRAYYKGQSRTTLAELRRPYDMLLMKVLSLLQDSDPPLARDIVASRDAIWGILADRTKFTEAKLMAGATP